MSHDTKLWYDLPARTWPHAMPIGNGRLGAMVYGGIAKDCWQMNEDSVWHGGKRDRNPPDALRNLAQLRQLLDEERIVEAEALAQKSFVAIPEGQRHYETLADVQLMFPHTEDQVKNYRRELDLGNALASIVYDVDDIRYTREIFSSYAANVIAAKVTASTPGSVSFALRVRRTNHLPEVGDVKQYDSCLYMDGIDVIDGCLVMKAATGGNGVHIVLTVTVCIDGGKHDHLSDSKEAIRTVTNRFSIH